MRDKTKIIALVALIIAVVGLGIGFAAFSTQLTISSGATVTPNKSDWNIVIEKVSCNSLGGATIVSQPTIEGTTVSGMEVAFTGPSQNLSCNFKITNTGKYRAYLTKMEYVEDTLGCESLEETDENFPEGYTRADDTLVAEACKGIKSNFKPFVMLHPNLVVGVNGDSTSLVKNNIWTINDISDTEDEVSYALEPDGFTATIFTINYDETASRADGPFVVRIPDLELTFSTTPTVQ